MTDQSEILHTGKHQRRKPDGLNALQKRSMRNAEIQGQNINSYDDATRSFEFVLASEKPVRNYRVRDDEVITVDEVLLMSGVQDVSALVNAPILNSHRSFDVSDVVGVITEARIEDNRLICRGRLSERETVDDIAEDIKSGILTSMSVGYDIISETLTERDGHVPLVEVSEWVPREGSLVPVPADSSAKIRSRVNKMANPSKNSGERSDYNQDQERNEGEDAQAAVDAATSEVERLRNELSEAEENLRALTGDDENDRSEPEEGDQREGSGDQQNEPARMEHEEEKRSEADEAVIRGLRGVAKRNGSIEDFEALYAAKATVSELRQAALASMSTRSVRGATMSKGSAQQRGGPERLMRHTEVKFQ